MPHRLRIGRLVRRQIFRLVRFEIEEPDIRVHPAAIPLPRPEIDRDGNVGERFAIERDRAEFAVGQRQFLRQPAVRGDFVKLIKPVLLARARGGEENRLAVRVPAEHAIGRSMVGDPPGQPAARRHGINIRVAVVISAEGDHGAVRRKAWKGFLAARRAEALRVAAFPGRDPDVARIDEGNPGRGHVGITKHPRINSRARGSIGRRRRGGNRKGFEQENTGQEERWD